MIDRAIALEALGALSDCTVTSVQQQRSQHGFSSFTAAAAGVELSTKRLIPTVMRADLSRVESRRILYNIVQDGGRQAASGALPNILTNDGLLAAGGAFGNIAQGGPQLNLLDLRGVSGAAEAGKLQLRLLVDEEEFFDPRFDYDFTNLTDSRTYWRGEEKYERPCGYQRFALKVLDKYDDGNTWLGNQLRSTESVPGEWPVSYHGTTVEGAEGIIEERYKPGSRMAYGRGVYSTPDISVADEYAVTFMSKRDNKNYKVILQNRINPEERKICSYDKYWLIPIPQSTSAEEEQKIIERAIRPYGLLIKEEGPSSCTIL
ncbi:uncharacterized protein [Trachinotus anak]|uniref:uncharacterized protein n=1 Tax=Trachinotus anak TaxID=443729 RepID=UPI0039F17E02